MSEDKWRCLIIETDPIKASILEGRLKEEGIPVVLQSEAIGQIYSLTVGPLAEIKVLVPYSWLDKAKEIVKEIEKNA